VGNHQYSLSEMASKSGKCARKTFCKGGDQEVPKKLTLTRTLSFDLLI